MHQSGAIGRLWTLEITGAGVGVLDFDGDGRYDVWLVQGGPIDARQDAEALPKDRLYKNVSRDGQLRFTDVTESAGVDSAGYGMGVATGDIDNDGDTDVFVANFGPNRLFENLGDGRFRDITQRAGVAGDAWSISASFADIDGDGLLDLYVGNYLEFDVAAYEPCRRWSSRASYCAPSNFTPEADILYLNAGDGRFVDVTASSGVAKGPAGGAMGVVADDFDGDGTTDFYVANDGLDNKMLVNNGDGTFEDAALLAGTAVNGDGVAEASMGIAPGDFDRDGDVDLLVSHDVKESNTLYVNGGGYYDDKSKRAGFAAASLAHSAFGIGWLDVENDGDLDVLVANGSVTIIEAQASAGIEPALREPNHLLLNDGAGEFRRDTTSPALAVEDASRGLALADLDNDGDVDAVLTNNHGPARVLENVGSTGTRRWVGLELKGPDAFPHAIGAAVWREGAPERKHVHTDGSYASASDERIVFGLGGESGPQTVRVEWTDGAIERFGPLAPGRYHLLEYGAGSSPRTP